MARSTTRCTGNGVAVDAHDHLSGVDGGGGYHGPVDDQVGSDGEQRLVLGAERFSLGAVGDDHGIASGFGDGGQLDGRREPRAAPTAQATALDLGYERSRITGGVAEPVEVRIQIGEWLGRQ